MPCASGAQSLSPAAPGGCSFCWPPDWAQKHLCWCVPRCLEATANPLGQPSGVLFPLLNESCHLKSVTGKLRWYTVCWLDELVEWLGKTGTKKNSREGKNYTLDMFGGREDFGICVCRGRSPWEELDFVECAWLRLVMCDSKICEWTRAHLVVTHRRGGTPEQRVWRTQKKALEEKEEKERKPKVGFQIWRMHGQRGAAVSDLWEMTDSALHSDLLGNGILSMKTSLSCKCVEMKALHHQRRGGKMRMGGRKGGKRRSRGILTWCFLGLGSPLLSTRFLLIFIMGPSIFELCVEMLLQDLNR